MSVVVAVGLYLDKLKEIIAIFKARSITLQKKNKIICGLEQEVHYINSQDLVFSARPSIDSCKSTDMKRHQSLAAD